MKVTDFDGREYNFPPSGYVPDRDDTRPRSELHLKVRALLHSLFPTRRVLEEVPLPGTRLTADFYLPHRKTVVEAHGRQHFEYIEHFHGSRMGWVKAKRNDSLKLDWCQLNNIEHVELHYDGDEDGWRQALDED